ncbi:MAG: hypothetical protein ACRCZW_10695 [Lactobacillaceae bacterium]
MNSKAEKKFQINEGDYIELEKRIEGTEINLKEKIKMIYAIKTELSIKHLKQFKDIAMQNGCNYRQMVLIYHGIL